MNHNYLAIPNSDKQAKTLIETIKKDKLLFLSKFLDVYLSLKIEEKTGIKLHE